MTLTVEDLHAISELLDSRLEIKLQPIRDDIEGLKAEVNELRTEMNELRAEVNELRAEVKALRTDVDRLKVEMKEVQRRLTLVELHLENETDKNIRILAENRVAMVNKLNEEIKTVNKSALYEIKVDYLTKEMQKLREEVEVLKTKIA